MIKCFFEHAKMQYFKLGLVCALIGLIVPVVFISCDKDETIKVPTVNFLYDTNATLVTYIRNGDVLEYSLMIDTVNSSKGIQIDKVEYLWDDVSIKTALDSKHSLSYLIEKQSNGEHKLKAVAHCSGKGYSNTQYTVTHPITVVEELPIVNYIIECPDTVSKSDTFTCSIRPDENNTLNLNIDKVTYLWDLEQLLETSMKPYVFSYPLTNVHPGGHLLIARVRVVGDWTGTIPFTKIIYVE